MAVPARKHPVRVLQPHRPVRATSPSGSWTAHRSWWETTTTPAAAAPTLVVVGGSGPFVARCREAAAASGGVAVATDKIWVTELCRRRRPRAIVVTSLVYASEPQAYLSLAREVGARLVNLPGERLTVGELTTAFQRVLRPT